MITREEYNKALSVCEEYLKQESKSVSIIDNAIKSLLNDEKRLKSLDNIDNWLKAKKGDLIKLVRVREIGNTKVKKGEVLKVRGIYKETFDLGYYIKLKMTIIAKIQKREYRMICIVYYNDNINTQWAFKIM